MYLKSKYILVIVASKLAADRVRELKDGRKVVLAEKVFEFLAWASKLFDISVCSLGDQSYVDMVVQVLNSDSLLIRGGVTYSARGEYLFLAQQRLERPPKDLNSLFAFYSAKNLQGPLIEPLIIDDNASMWPSDQQDNIVIIKEKCNSPVWNVSLFPVVQQVLTFVHEGFFHNFDIWLNSSPETRGNAPSTLTFYKEFLRKELSNHIAEC